MSQRSLALLRGVNVGGKRPMTMAALAEVFTDLGCTAIQTYIQSGNILFTPPAAALTAGTLARCIEQRFGFPVPVVVRTAEAFASSVASNPFLAQGMDQMALKQLHAVFLAEPLEPEQLIWLSSQAEGSEQLAALGNEIYLYLPYGFGRSKLAIACTSRRFPATGTIRNWTTVLKLAELLAGK